MLKKLNIILALCILAIVMLTACSSNSNTETEIQTTGSNNSTSNPIQSSTPLPLPSKSVNSEAILHVDGNKKIPVAVRMNDFYEVEDAVYIKNDYAKALAMIQQGKILMVENNSPVIVIEPYGYLTKIKIKKGGRTGWVKSSWLQ